MGDLSTEYKNIIKSFMKAVKHLDYDLIDRIILSLQNEKKIRQTRETYIEQMIDQAGFSREDAEKSIIRFQREIEQATITSYLKMDGEEEVKEPIVNKIKKEKTVVNNEKKNDVDLDKLCEDLED